MEGFVIKNSSRNNLKQIGDKIILNLIEKGIETKYRILGNYIFLESKEDINYNKVIKEETYNGKLSTAKKKGFLEKMICFKKNLIGDHV